MGAGQMKYDLYDAIPTSGQLVGLVSGTAYPFPTGTCNRMWIKAHPLNSGIVWIGQYSGTVNGSTGFPLSATSQDGVQLLSIPNPAYLYANFDKAGDRVCWIIETRAQVTY